MSAPQLPPPEDDPGRSPRLLQPLPKRGAGVRRLNRVPVFVFVAGVCLVVGAIGYTYRARLQSSAAALHDAETKAGGRERRGRAEWRATDRRDPVGGLSPDRRPAANATTACPAGAGAARPNRWWAAAAGAGGRSCRAGPQAGLADLLPAARRTSAIPAAGRDQCVEGGHLAEWNDGGGGAAAQAGAGAGGDPQLAQAQGTATQSGAAVPAAYTRAAASALRRAASALEAATRFFRPPGRTRPARGKSRPFSDKPAISGRTTRSRPLCGIRSRPTS